MEQRRQYIACLEEVLEVQTAEERREREELLPGIATKLVTVEKLDAALSGTAVPSGTLPVPSSSTK